MNELELRIEVERLILRLPRGTQFLFVVTGPPDRPINNVFSNMSEQTQMTVLGDVFERMNTNSFVHQQVKAPIPDQCPELNNN